MPSDGFSFTDLAHLDRVIGSWVAVRDTIGDNGLWIEQAINPIMPPADDTPSSRQAATYRESLVRALRHNNAMLDYAKGYVDRLTASRDQYAAVEQDNVERVRRAGDR